MKPDTHVNTRTRGGGSLTFQFAIVGLTAAVFALDAFTPLGVAVWLFYLAPLSLSFWATPRFGPFIVAAVCTGLTAWGFFLSLPAR